VGLVGIDYDKVNMENENKVYKQERKNGVYLGFQIPEAAIREAMANSKSNKGAARYLKVSYKTYKRYASKFVDQESGKTLFELHLNKEGSGIKKSNIFVKPGVTKLQSMLRKNQWFSEERFAVLKKLLVITGTLSAYCCACGYDKRRMLDNRIPLVLTFQDDDRTNWELENLQWYCYNCAFHYSLPNNITKLKPSWVRRIVLDNGINEDGITKEQFNNFYNLDDMYYEHLKNVGLQPEGDLNEMDVVAYEDPDEDPMDGTEFIDLKV